MQRLVRRGPDLDEIVDAHEKYLHRIQVKSMLLIPGLKVGSLVWSSYGLLLTARHAERVTGRVSVLQKAPADSSGDELVQTHSCEICGFLRTGYNDRPMTTRCSYFQDRLTRWMETEITRADGDSPIDPADLDTQQFIEIQASLSEHKRRFQEQVHALLRLLRIANDESLRALGDRINFNDHYSVTQMPFDY